MRSIKENNEHIYVMMNLNVSCLCVFLFSFCFRFRVCFLFCFCDSGSSRIVPSVGKRNVNISTQYRRPEGNCFHFPVNVFHLRSARLFSASRKQPANSDNDHTEQVERGCQYLPQ